MVVIEGLFRQLFNMSITGSYVILAILIVRLVFRGMPKNFSYALWIVAGLRLICPFSFSAPFSLFSLKLFSSVVAQSADDRTLTFMTGDLGRIISPSVKAVLPAAEQSGQDSLPAAVSAASVQFSQWGWLIAAVIWIIGVVMLLIIAIATYVRVRRLVDSAVRLEGNVYEADKIPSPFILGFLRPRIFIPFHLAAAEQDYILRHERYHLRRGDHWLKPVAYLLLMLHWFNPMVWFAYYLMGHDMEMSCDEAVLNKMSDSIKYDYSASLLAMATRRPFLAASPLAYGESNARLRIKNILKFRKPQRWVIVLAVAVCLAIAAACLANPLKLAQPTSAAQLAALDEAIHAAILWQNQDATSASDYQTEAHTILKTVDSKTQVTAYLVAMYLEYSQNDDGSLEKQRGNHMPVALTLTKDTAGNLKLSEYWIPTDGDDYGRSIRTKFPADIEQAALASYTFSASHEKICEDYARSYFASNKTAAVFQFNSIRQYMQYDLPAALTVGSDNRELGYLGGNLFGLKATGDFVAEAASDSTPPGWHSYGGAEIFYQLNCQFANGQLKHVSLPWNHAVYLTNAESIENCAAPAVMFEVSFDLYTQPEASKNHIAKDKQTSKMWYVFFTREDSKISYAIFLNAEHFSKEATVTLAKSVEFSDDAFSLVVQ